MNGSGPRGVLVEQGRTTSINFNNITPITNHQQQPRPSGGATIKKMNNESKPQK